MLQKFPNLALEQLVFPAARLLFIAVLYRVIFLIRPALVYQHLRHSLTSPYPRSM